MPAGTTYRKGQKMSTDHPIVKLTAASGPQKSPYGGYFATFDALCDDGETRQITQHARLLRDIKAYIANPASLLRHPMAVIVDNGRVIGTNTTYDLRARA